MPNGAFNSINYEEVDPWTDYWQTGAPISYIASPEMEAQLTRLWEQFVDGLRTPARILDLATGNGVVALKCALRARVRGIQLNIDAVDVADINPKSCIADPHQLLPHVNFRGGVQLESLPFDDGEFAGVVSQFGLEYAREEQAVPEVSRVLAPGGRLRLIIHAHDGAVSRDIGQRLERLDAALAINGPVGLVLTLVRAYEAGDNETIQRKSKYLKTATELAQRFAINPLPDDSAQFYSSEFLRLWSKRMHYRPADMRRSAIQGWVNAKGTAIRQAQMLRAARTSENIDDLCRRFESIGVEVTGVNRVQDHHRKIQASWLINGRKVF
jgi:SAM-dependent methyltransferase